MLQIEHIYEFLYSNLFFDHSLSHFPRGVPSDADTVDFSDIITYSSDGSDTKPWVFFYDQEPILSQYIEKYIKLFKSRNINPNFITSEQSKQLIPDYKNFYYFYHGFAALDWFRGYKILNHNKKIVKSYSKDYLSFNRLILNDRSYRIYFTSQLLEKNILDKGAVSFSVADKKQSWKDEITDKNSKLSEHAKRHAVVNLSGKNIESLILDGDNLSGSQSADILRPQFGYRNPNFLSGREYDTDAFWHIVTETVFYYDKLHLTEKIFKPIVSKQPFMLLAAPGNLEYLRSYGFKTFAGIIDESYDDIKDNDARIEAVVAQIKWYCDLTDDEKTEIQRKCEPIIEHNFHHFYGKFKEIITDELLDNTKKLFEDIGYDDANVDYATVRKLLVS